MKRIFVGIVCAVAGIVAVVVLAAGILAWRLTAGPVALGPLTPIIELALNSVSAPMRVAVEDAVLAWDRSDGILNVRLVEARATSGDREVVLSVPDLSVALDMDALLRGKVAPTDIHIVRPDLKVVRAADEHSDRNRGKDGDTAGPALSNLMSVLARLSDPEVEAQGLREIRITGGSLDVEDGKTGLAWRGRLRNTRVWRDPAGINAKGFLAATSDGQESELAITAEYVSSGRELRAGVSFDRIRPAMFAALGSSLRSLAAIDLPVRGTLGLLAGGDGTIERSIFDLVGGAGHLALPVSVAEEFGILAAAQRLAVRGVELDGTYTGEGVAVDVDRLSIDVEPGQTVYLPEPINHRMPLAALRAQGHYRGDQKSAEVASLDLDLDGPSIAASGTAEGIGTAGGLKAAIEIVAKGIRTNDFPRYWPSALGASAYEWCMEHLSDGGISEARIALSLTGSGDGIEIASLSGEMDIEGVAVDYLPPMPKARNASGVAVFDLNSLTVTIGGAEADGVSVRGGTAKLYDFSHPPEKADIELSIQGPIPKVLELIDHPPLGYVKRMGLSPSQTSGSVSGRLRLRFPLLEDMPIERLTLSAEAKLDDVAVTKIVLGADVTGGQLTIKLDDKGMDVNGPIVVEKTPAAIAWRENFATGAPFDTRIDIAIANADIGLLRDLKFADASLVEDYVDGPLGINVRYVTYPSGEDSVEIKADAQRAALAFAYFGWKKERGVPATGVIQAKMQGDRLMAISSLALESEGLDVRGSAQFDQKGQLEKAVLERMIVGRTDMEATIAAGPQGGWAIDVDGKSLDVKPLIDALEQPATDDRPVSPVPSPLSITANLEKVLIDPKHPLQQVSGSILREGDLWALVKVDARVGKDSPLSLTIAPGKENSRSLQVRSSNAGDTLRSLGVYKHMIGGELNIKGSFDDRVAGNPLNGKVKVHDYRITKAPGMAKVLSIMALTGILDQLRGKGLGFAIFDAPFTLHNDALEIRNARASGTELGLTAEGRVANDIIDIRGTIVPFYAVNSMLGKIPIVGPIFSGGEKGGGLLAARYSVTGAIDDPDVTVNPLSMLTPGFLRNLFDVFDSDSGSGNGGTAKTPLPQSGRNDP